jgi:hypothetical protein
MKNYKGCGSSKSRSVLNMYETKLYAEKLMFDL